jgi:uncharacterized membrane protein YccC
VQARLARLYSVLGHYVHFKASLFEPLRGIDIERKRLSLSQLNAEVVAELDAAKESIFRRIGARAPAGRIARYRGLYLIAQDVHERASSSHDDYNALADAFFHSDLLYRCRRVLHLQGEACARLAQSIERREPFVADGATLRRWPTCAAQSRTSARMRASRRGGRCWHRSRRWRAISSSSKDSWQAPPNRRRGPDAPTWACSIARRAPGATRSNACGGSSRRDRRCFATRCGWRSRSSPAGA